jgi:hypothetical protein
VALLGLAIFLGLWPQALIELSAAWVNDFLSHTVGHLGAAALALAGQLEPLSFIK